MKHSKEKMLTKAIQVLKDLNPTTFEEKNIEGLKLIEDKELARPLDTIMDAWTVYIRDPYFNALDFLVLSDETGEPLYYQNFNMIIGEIVLGSDGKYTLIESKL